MTWWERLKQIMDARGLTPEQVAERAGVPVKSVYGYLNGQVANPRGNVLQRLAAAVGATELYIRHGAEAADVVDLRKIPLLTMNKLGTIRKGQSVLDVWDGVTVVAVPSEISDTAFGVVLQDDSGAPEFAAGDIIICDPKAEQVPGRYVLAAIDKLAAAFFGRFRPTSLDRKRFQIIPVNAHYPTIEVDPENPGHIVARAIKHIRSI